MRYLSILALCLVTACSYVGFDNNEPLYLVFEKDRAYDSAKSQSAGRIKYVVIDVLQTPQSSEEVLAESVYVEVIKKPMSQSSEEVLAESVSGEVIKESIPQSSEVVLAESVSGETIEEPMMVEYAGNETFKVADYEIKKGQQMRKFFDEFKEPMYVEYMGNDNILWTYYLNNDGKIVRYCEFMKYDEKSLCKMNVRFYKTYVADVSSDC